MQLFFTLILCFLGLVSHSNAAESTKESLILLPINGVNLLVADILNRYSMTASENKPAAAYSGSFEDYKKRQMEEFDAFKRGNPTPQQIEERKRADAKALADRIGIEESRLQSSFQWALNEGLQNRYQVFFSGSHPDTKLVATGNITKREYGYFLEFAIKGDSNQVVYSNSALCQQCNEIQIGVKFGELGNVPMPVAVVHEAPPQPIPLPVASAPSTDNCYEDEFVQVCITKAEGGKYDLPSLAFSLKNLTNDKFFVASNGNPLIVVKDNDGNACSNYADGIDGNLKLLSPGKSFNFYWNWSCKGQKPSGNELIATMNLQRKPDMQQRSNFFTFAAKAQGWK